MTDQYTGRARITNKQTGATREGEVVNTPLEERFTFGEDGTSRPNTYNRADFTIEPILPDIPSEPGDTFTAEVTRNGVTKRVMVIAVGRGYWRSAWAVDHSAKDIDRATIESVITAKERGL